MPQELHVVRCFSCETFQVDVVKKITKWTCKMCGEKQTLKKVYGRGTGKDCRTIVQNLNRQRVSLQQLESAGDIETHVTSEDDDVEGPQVKNKWSEFLVDVNNEGDDGKETSNFTFERHRNKRRKDEHDYAHQNTVLKEANKQLLPRSPQSTCAPNDNDDERHYLCKTKKMSQKEECNSKWTEFCFQDAEDIDLDSLLEF